MSKRISIPNPYEDFYEDDTPLENYEPIPIGDKVGCETMAPRRINIAAKDAIKGISKKKGDKKSDKPTREKALEDLHDKIMDLVEETRDTAGMKCDGSSTKCEHGFCYTDYEIDDRRIKCRKVRRKGKSVWMCSYYGNISHSCICVA